MTKAAGCRPGLAWPGGVRFQSNRRRKHIRNQRVAVVLRMESQLVGFGELGLLGCLVAGFLVTMVAATSTFATIWPFCMVASRTVTTTSESAIFIPAFR